MRRLVGVTVLAALAICASAAQAQPPHNSFVVVNRTHASWLPRDSVPVALPRWRAWPGITRSSGSGATLCVGAKPGCYSSIQTAVDAANEGDTIRIAPGMFVGGLVITKSLDLQGAGAGETVISGGGPVITIGTFGASNQPTVAISGVTITGGITSSTPNPFVGEASVWAAGGGIEVPPGEDASGLSPGAAVTITNSVISGNRVAPTATLSSPSGASCPDGPCPFAAAIGGGIDNWGTMTLRNTRVMDNSVGATPGLPNLTSDAEGGGIVNWFTGTLSLTNSVVSGNRAVAAAPNGRFADAGGIFDKDGRMTIENSVVSGNSALLTSVFPNSVVTLALAGGIHVSNSATASITNTTISGNSVRATNTVSDAVAFSGGLHTDTDVTVDNTTIADNSVSVTTLPGAGTAYGDSGGGYVRGTITNTRFTRNTVAVTTAAGDAIAAAGAAILRGTVTNSSITHNTATATTTSGNAIVVGAGLVNLATLTLANSSVASNTAAAAGPTGIAQGGGIWNGPFPGGPEIVQLTFTNTSITNNTIDADPAITRQGGGLYTAVPVTIVHSTIEHNTPDQCFGC
jgi:hypothetical protein